MYNTSKRSNLHVKSAKSLAKNAMWRGPRDHKTTGPWSLGPQDCRTRAAAGLRATRHQKQKAESWQDRIMRETEGAIQNRRAFSRPSDRAIAAEDRTPRRFALIRAARRSNRFWSARLPIVWNVECVAGDGVHPGRARDRHWPASQDSPADRAD